MKFAADYKEMCVSKQYESVLILSAAKCDGTINSIHKKLMGNQRRPVLLLLLSLLQQDISHGDFIRIRLIFL
jgi:hypothetical protein